MGLDTVELVMCWEEEFSIRIPDADKQKLTTPREAGDLIERLILEDGRQLAREEIDQIVKLCTIENCGVAEEIYHLDGKFVEDFGLD